MDVIRLALYQPDIPQNTGAMMRLAACLGVSIDVIEPTGFVWDEKRMRRTGMDYRELAAVTKHASWDAYQQDRAPGRLLLLTTKGAEPYQTFDYRAGDTLVLGRESAGVPDDVHQSVDARLLIPMMPQARSLNVALSAAIVLGEALRQTQLLPPFPAPALPAEPQA
jgi:tRNA (cytidine/uridine-2'-O-)-methyltransferase